MHKGFGVEHNDTEKDDKGGARRSGVLNSLRERKFGLHSDGSLLSLWRFSAKSRKKLFLTSSAEGVVVKKCFLGGYSFNGIKVSLDQHCGPPIIMPFLHLRYHLLKRL